MYVIYIVYNIHIYTYVYMSIDIDLCVSEYYVYNVYLQILEYDVKTCGYHALRQPYGSFK